MIADEITRQLNAPLRHDRLAALQQLRGHMQKGALTPPTPARNVNNHIHTTYSFSPYSPSMALWTAYRAGLETAGIMDHDSIYGAEEFIEAGTIIGMLTTVGVECRADFGDTPFAERRLNNPDQTGIAYVTLHGIPHHRFETVKAFFHPLTEARGQRNRAMTERLNDLLRPYGLTIDYDQDVLPLSMHHDGGAVTERHLIFAVCRGLIDRFGQGDGLTTFLRREMGLSLSPRHEEQLNDADNPHYAYDLLGALKSRLVERFYLPAAGECAPVADVIALAEDIGAICAYAYLGDVGDSVTGDKKTQTFEDAYLDELTAELAAMGMRSITYMPSRNTDEQLQRLKALCRHHGFFEISGEDINSPRQSFVCEALRRPEFANLFDSTYALIGHELSETDQPGSGFFTAATLSSLPDLEQRIAYFASVARERQKQLWEN